MTLLLCYISYTTPLCECGAIFIYIRYMWFIPFVYKGGKGAPDYACAVFAIAHQAQNAYTLNPPTIWGIGFQPKQQISKYANVWFRIFL